LIFAHPLLELKANCVLTGTETHGRHFLPLHWTSPSNILRGICGCNGALQHRVEAPLIGQLEPLTSSLTVVVPFLNEAENLPILHEQLRRVMDEQCVAAELLFVDDGSVDGGPEWLLRRRQDDPSIRVVRLSRNFGHQVAITAGLDLAGGDAVVIMDADLQDPPDLIPAMLAKWREGYHVVCAQRTTREGESVFKKACAFVFYRLFKMAASVNVAVDTGDFRLLDRRVVEALRSMRETHRFLRAMASWTGFRHCTLPFERRPRHAGQTKYPRWKSLCLAWDGLTSFSGAPLRWVSAMGFFVSLLGGLWLVRILLARLTHPWTQEVGWASTISAILLIGGIQLLALGLLGQYMSRTYEESKRRPLYFIGSDTAAPPPASGREAR
jgi:polyisoprenyl-phosphate glycosyltransferase